MCSAGNSRRISPPLPTACRRPAARRRDLNSLAPTASPSVPQTAFHYVPDRSGLLPLNRYATLHARRRPPPGRRVHGSEPRVPASVPPLPGGADLQRTIQSRAAGRRAGRHRGSGRRRRAAHHVRRSRFFQRPDSRRAHRRGASRSSIRLVTYDVTIKVEHLLQHVDLLPRLRDTGCLFVTSAVESLDDRVLEISRRGTRGPTSLRRSIAAARPG